MSKYSDRELEQADDFLSMNSDEQMEQHGKQQVHPEFLTKKYLLRDLEHLSNHDISKLYKYVRRYLIAEIPSLDDPLEFKCESNQKIFTLSGSDVLKELTECSTPEYYQYVPAHLHVNQQVELERLREDNKVLKEKALEEEE